MTVQETSKSFMAMVTVAAALVGGGSALASNTKTLVADIRGAQEVPANASAGRGCGRFIINTNNNTIAYHISFGGLGSAEIAAHFHGPAGPGVNAGVLQALPLGNPKIGTWTYPEAVEADILNGKIYVNIHTNGFPGGEIRGQVNHFAAALDPGQEPGVVAPGSQGWATFHIDPCANTLTYHIVVEALGAPETAAHIHGMALPNSNAGILHTLPAGPLKTGTWTYNESQEAAILNGQTYVNVHTTANPGGEIRGQICNTVVPLDGAQETPPNTQPGIGCGWVGINTTTHTLGYYVTYFGLSGPETASHIHGFSGFGAPSGVQHTLTPASPTNPKKGQWVYGAANAANIFGDQTYFNIHTGAFGGGEIRGQIVVPIPKCRSDVNCDGTSNVSDLLSVIGTWGPCPTPPTPCNGDLDGNGLINVSDLLAVIAGWGKCP